MDEREADQIRADNADLRRRLTQTTHQLDEAEARIVDRAARIGRLDGKPAAGAEALRRIVEHLDRVAGPIRLPLRCGRLRAELDQVVDAIATDPRLHRPGVRGGLGAQGEAQHLVLVPGRADADARQRRRQQPDVCSHAPSVVIEPRAVTRLRRRTPRPVSTTGSAYDVGKPRAGVLPLPAPPRRLLTRCAPAPRDPATGRRRAGRQRPHTRHRCCARRRWSGRCRARAGRCAAD